MEVKEKIKTEIVVDHIIPVEILDDLSSRFIINVPQEERKDLIRICFQVELAHWFYLDFYCTEENGKLKPCGMKEFTTHIFQHIPYLRQFANSIDGVLEQWRDYKQNVPTFGAILLNEELTHVLLVQSYWARTSWGFPKGKVNKEEDPTKCAVREVLEETGFDISKMINANDYIESNVNDQLIRLYIVTGISIDTKFQPQTRNEIKAVEWFLLSDLPSTKKDMTPKLKIGVSPNSFFMVVPFMKRLKRWVSDKVSKTTQSQNNPGPFRRQRHKSMGDIESSSSNLSSFNSNVNFGMSNSKSRKQQQFSNSMQAELQELQMMQALKNMNTNTSSASSPPRNTRQRHDKDRKQPFKRKLNFNNNNGSNNNNQDVDGSHKARSQYISSRSKTPQQNSIMVASSWINFKFNREAILKAFLTNDW
ncbi:m7GpppN-mRNA hydrolase-like [Lycorma delicatula]|uniref:m7GpppN-mRNA hydrolase-like n=1 Tax=Lycorma delicatula TaxID=130591 RepID=UPI003F510A53